MLHRVSVYLGRSETLEGSFPAGDFLPPEQAGPQHRLGKLAEVPTTKGLTLISRCIKPPLYPESSRKMSSFSSDLRQPPGTWEPEEASE